MPETYAEQLARVRSLATEERYVMLPREKVALRAVLARLDALETPASCADTQLTVKSQEHSDLMDMFEREHRGQRLDRENKSLWTAQHVYQNGETNCLFLAYRRGYAYGRSVAASTKEEAANVV